MKYLRSFDEEWTVFVNAFDKLIQNNNGVVSLAAMIPFSGQGWNATCSHALGTQIQSYGQ